MSSRLWLWRSQCLWDWQCGELNICSGGRCQDPLCSQAANPFIPFCWECNWTLKMWLIIHGWMREYWPLLVLLSWLNVSHYHCLMPGPEGLVILSGSHRAESPISYFLPITSRSMLPFLQTWGNAFFLLLRLLQIHFEKPNIQMNCSVVAFHQI